MVFMRQVQELEELLAPPDPAAVARNLIVRGCVPQSCRSEVYVREGHMFEFLFSLILVFQEIGNLLTNGFGILSCKF